MLHQVLCLNRSAQLVFLCTDVKKKNPEKNVVHDFHVKTRARVYNRFLIYTAKHQIYTCKSRLVYISFPSLQLYDYDVKLTITLCFMEDVNKLPRNFLFLSELGYMWLFIGILLQESSPTFDKVSELVTKLVSCYVHDPYFITFGHVFLDKNLGLVDPIYQRFGNSRFWNLISLSRAKFKVGFQPK